MKNTNSLLITIILIFSLVIPSVLSALGDPVTFGNATTDTVWIGGTTGVINATGKITAGEDFSGNLNWTYLRAFPANCSSGQFSTGVGDTIYCDTPTGTQNTSEEIRNAVNGTWTYAFEVNWSNVLNRLITAINPTYLFITGTTLGLNGTKLNETIDARDNNTWNTSVQMFVAVDNGSFRRNETTTWNTTTQMFEAVDNGTFLKNNSHLFNTSNQMFEAVDNGSFRRNETTTWNTSIQMFNAVNNGSFRRNETVTWNSSTEMFEAVDNGTFLKNDSHLFNTTVQMFNAVNNGSLRRNETVTWNSSLQIFNAVNNGTFGRLGDCPSNQWVQNITNSNPECSAISYVETDPFWTGNQSLYATLDAPIFTTNATLPNKTLIGRYLYLSSDTTSYLDLTSTLFLIYLGGNQKLSLSDDGLLLGGTGARVNAFVTTISSDDDTDAPTEGAVFDYVAAQSHNNTWNTSIQMFNAVNNGSFRRNETVTWNSSLQMFNAVDNGSFRRNETTTWNTSTQMFNAVNNGSFRRNETVTWNSSTEMFNAIDNGTFLKLEGGTMVGDIEMGQNNVTINGSILAGVMQNANTNGPNFGIWQEGPSGTLLPHFLVQSGGGTQASYIMRSFMIVNENESFFNSTERTSCSSYMNSIGETLKIDCNTTTTGADLLVSDDFQAAGDIWVKDSGGEWHFLSTDLETFDELFDDILFNKITSSLSGTNFSFVTAQGDNITVNVNQTETIFSTDRDWVAITLGTNETPVMNWLTYQPYTAPTLTRSASEPSAEHAEAGRILAGDTGQVYASITGRKRAYEFVKEVYERFFDEGAIYVSGFGITSNSTEVAFANGVMKVMITSHNVAERNNISNEYFTVLNNGTYRQYNLIDNITQYGDGGTISNNKYFNVVFGLVMTDTNTDVAQMVAVVQNEPASEYTTLVGAEIDQYDSVTVYPSTTFVKNMYIPIARVIAKKVSGTDTIEQLSNGLYHFDMRGTTTGTTGASPSPSISDHSLLTNLDYANAGHTGFRANTTTTWNTTGQMFEAVDNGSLRRNETVTWNTSVQMFNAVDNGSFRRNETVTWNNSIEMFNAVDNGTFGRLGDCPTNKWVQNITNGDPECSTPTLAGSETDPLWSGNQSLYATLDVPIFTTNVTLPSNTFITRYLYLLNSATTYIDMTASTLQIYIGGNQEISLTDDGLLLGGAGSRVNNFVDIITGDDNTDVPTEGAVFNMNASMKNYVDAVNGSVTWNTSVQMFNAVDNGTFGRLGDCGSNTFIQNITNGDPECGTPVDTDTDTHNTSIEMFNAVNNGTFGRLGDCGSNTFVQNVTNGAIECGTPVDTDTNTYNTSLEMFIAVDNGSFRRNETVTWNSSLQMYNAVSINDTFYHASSLTSDVYGFGLRALNQNLNTTSNVAFDVVTATAFTPSGDSTNHNITDNATCMILSGDTAKVVIC